MLQPWEGRLSWMRILRKASATPKGRDAQPAGPREATVNRSLQTEHHRATDPPCPLGMGGPEGGAAATRPQPGVPVAYRRWRWLRHVPASTWLCSELRRGFGPPLVPASDAPRVCAARIGPRTRACGPGALGARNRRRRPAGPASSAEPPTGSPGAGG